MPHAVTTGPDPQRAQVVGGVPALAPGPVLDAVLCALAGVRRGERVACLGVSATLRRAMLAGAGADAEEAHQVDLAVAGRAYEVPSALLLLRAGGRLVAVAGDPQAPQRLCRDYSLQLRHVERVGPCVAWSAVRPVAGPLPNWHAQSQLDA